MQMYLYIGVNQLYEMLSLMFSLCLVFSLCLPFKELELAITHDAWRIQWWLYSFFLWVHSSLLSMYSDVDKPIKSYMVWMSSIFSWWSHFTVSPSSNKISLLKRQHWPITNISESTNIQGLSKSFENSKYSYPSNTTCVEHLLPLSLCYPWSRSYHLSNHVTFCRIFTSHMLYHHSSSHMLLVHSFHVSKPSQHILINSTRRLSFHFFSPVHFFVNVDYNYTYM